MRLWLPAILAISLSAGCSHENPGSADEPLNSESITLPDGSDIRAEVLTRPAEMEHGMMYRDALPHRRALLFVHQQPGYYRYWMPNVKVPLDIIFMDASRKIVEISANTPICTTKPEDCLTYGGSHLEQYVLEMRAGEAQRLGLSVGQTLGF
jgi:uncharacterized membrane protein (UPF0127 family)